ncbi:hypothetical protein [Halorussus sp. MSC15.2]|uniref:DUF7266 family protein n=1 Tax=Halorussus sp. MSC15.2 TaxID=2283638 RepID=UPI0013D05800|nr:hypothetical protein [Halorussus sp. MSC15.2]NEU56725.1 hypothetical protein [Halorussus sp. MSC15.2]
MTRPRPRRGGQDEDRGGIRRRLRADDRGVSVTVNYALNLVVATLLIGGVLTATGGMVDDRRESAARTELSVLGERVATDLMAADRLAEVGRGDETVAVSVTLPERVAGARYEVEIDATASGSTILLRSDHPEVTVRVGFRNATAVESTTVRGGDLRIELNTGGSPDRLEVSSA